LYELARQRLTPETLFERAAMEEGPFGEHLRRLALSLRQEPSFVDAVRKVIDGTGIPRGTCFTC
jgi:serine/threonine-protein kinase